jgi:murein DD-endopeptidase MepM/ murein hydrolase activator NlpD
MKKRMFGIALFVFPALFVGVFGAVVVFADEVCEDDETVEECQERLRKELEDSQKKQESYSIIVDIKQKEASLYHSQIQSLAAQEAKISNDIADNQEKLSQVERDIVSLTNDISAKEKSIDLQKNILSNLMREYYDRQRSTISVAFAAQEAGDSVFSSNDRSLTVQSRMGELLVNIVTAKESMERDKSTLEGKRSELETITEKLSKQETYLEGAQAQKRELLDGALQEKGKYAWRLDKVEEEIQKILEKIGAIETSKLAMLDLESVPDFGSGVLGYPVDDSQITKGIRYCVKNQPSLCTQDFGLTNYAKSGAYGYDDDGKPNPHNGLDFGSGVGRSIYAAEDGKVIGVGSKDVYYGNWIAIEHDFDDDKKLITIYAHLSNVNSNIKKGKNVDKGDSIGIMGTTGYSTGVHLHFGVYQQKGFEFSGTRFYGVKLDPKVYLK